MFTPLSARASHLSWIRVARTKHGSARVYTQCVCGAASGVGCQTPTCASFSENPNLRGINESTCSARAARGSGAHCVLVPGLSRDFFVSPLESSESFEINLTTVPETEYGNAS